MKVKVVQQFYDKYNLARLFEPGEVVDFEKNRAEDIVKRGLGEMFEEPKVEPAVEEPKVEPVAEPKPRKPRKKKEE